ncbi:hypothetical protein L6164_019417 [Bauhinia variegata]|uniref:Uncharacterized protein n=1 Tax=Bauhinia variegata TaxID=167791 RepID=A0ACB9MV76_BAUVA|nr:hypothetical protein L6164_019417 [Bauhinia variegata]
MATPSSFAPSPITLTRTTATNKSYTLFSFSCSFPRIDTARRNFHLRSINSSVSTVSAAATTSIEAGVSPISATPSKPLPFRVGHGFDLHRLEPGYPLIIGGINIPHDRGCEAHSDGDVLLHLEGCASSAFIKEAVKLMHEAGYELGNLDVTLILQRPKLSPHKEAIKANLSALLEVDPSVVNLKAKSHEKIDSLGENGSIAVHTVVLLMRK